MFFCVTMNERNKELARSQAERNKTRPRDRDTERAAAEDRGQKANLAFTSNHSAKPFYSTRTEICFFSA